MEEPDDHSILLSDLLCEEDASVFRDDNADSIKGELCAVFESDEEFMQLLIFKEISFQSPGNLSVTDYTIKNQECHFKSARLDVIKWILQTRAFFGFHFRTAYLSLVYFDQLSSKQVFGNVEAVRLASVACFSLAAKMEEQSAPPLSYYRVGETELRVSQIRKMEFLVLRTLGWKMNITTPFAYLNYFISKFSGEAWSKEHVSRAVQLLLAITVEIDLAACRPSISAAAVILAAYDHTLTRDAVALKTSLIPSWSSLDEDHVFFCYNILQKMEIVKPKTPSSLISPNSLITNSSTSQQSSIVSAGGTKRRLSFNDCDQHSPSKKR